MLVNFPKIQSTAATENGYFLNKRDGFLPHEKLSRERARARDYIFPTWRTRELMLPLKFICQQTFPSSPRPRFRVRPHPAGNSSRPVPTFRTAPVVLSPFPPPPPHLSLSLSLQPCFYLMHKSRKFLAHAPFRPSECAGRARPINHRKTAISAKGGKYVANGAIGNSNSVASDENILWADERCAVCLTSGPAGSFVRVQCGKRARADDHARADNQPCLCGSRWKETGMVGGSL